MNEPCKLDTASLDQISEAVDTLAGETSGDVMQAQHVLEAFGLGKVAERILSCRDLAGAWICKLHHADHVFVPECGLCQNRVLDGSLYYQKPGRCIVCCDCIEDVLRVESGWDPVKNRTLQWLANLEVE